MDPLFGEELNVPKCRKDRKVEMADTESCLSEKDPKGSAEKQKTVSRLTQENVEILQKGRGHIRCLMCSFKLMDCTAVSFDNE